MNPIDDLIRKLDASTYVADLFLLLHLDELEQPTATNTEDVRLFVPACIDQLLTVSSDNSDAVLKAMLVWARPDLLPSNEEGIRQIIDDIRATYAALRHYQYLQPIADEVDSDVASALRRLLAASRGRTGPAAFMKGTVQQAVTTILSYSKRTSTAILMRGRQLAEFLRDWIVSLELPSRADQVVKKKATFAARLLAFKGGLATKFFVGLALSIGGLFPDAPPIVNVAGVALAFADP